MAYVRPRRQGFDFVLDMMAVDVGYLPNSGGHARAKSEHDSDDAV